MSLHTHLSPPTPLPLHTHLSLPAACLPPTPHPPHAPTHPPLSARARCIRMASTPTSLHQLHAPPPPHAPTHPPLSARARCIRVASTLALTGSVALMRSPTRRSGPRAAAAVSTPTSEPLLVSDPLSVAPEPGSRTPFSGSAEAINPSASSCWLVGGWLVGQLNGWSVG